MKNKVDKFKLVDYLKNRSLHFFNSYYKGYVEAIKDIIEFEETETEDTENGGLKPCPFCGTDVVVEKKPLWQDNGNAQRGYYGAYEFVIVCPNPECGCTINLCGNDTVYNKEEDCIKAVTNQWNKRV